MKKDLYSVVEIWNGDPPQALSCNLSKDSAERIAKWNMEKNVDASEAVSKGWLKFEAIKQGASK